MAKFTLSPKAHSSSAGYSAGSSASAKVVNHPTVGRVPDGALVERDSSLNLAQLPSVSILLNDPDFDAARELAAWSTASSAATWRASSIVAASKLLT